MSLTRKMETGCDSNDCSIRVLYLDICSNSILQIGTENTC